MMMINFFRALCALRVLRAGFFVAVAFAAAGGAAATKEIYLPPLHRAAADGDVVEVRRLISGGGDVDEKVQSDWAPMHAAAAFGQGDVVLVLFGAGAGINIKDIGGNTPLHLAALFGEIEAANALVKVGANMRARNNDNKTPLDIATEEHGKDSAIAVLLLDATKDGG